ncbi:hypothetical protein [Rhizobium grahamii]|uniref:Uncharacterized protein n=1 Tax=Rhizobium grahamii TaxID=1120045 RepID=A0A370KHS6_9HYPH|nr:hypothetical protein [Rhizobium grahamii]RDJ05073.1 hypothetical protein B5K06_26245 [Rhizobium grahamii]
MRGRKSFVLVIAACISLAAIIDPDTTGPEASFLRTFAEQLDDQGVDVVLGIASARSEGERPRLAALSGYRPGTHDWGSFGKQAWELAFEDARSGVIMAVESVPANLATQEGQCDAIAEDSEVCRFVDMWIASKPDKRIFVSFTAADFEAADAVRKSLEAAGYIVFVFLKGRHEEPWTSPALVGEVFQSAGHRLVIDTKSARGSPGVAFESLCCEPYLMAPSPTTKWSTRIATAAK